MNCDCLTAEAVLTRDVASRNDDNAGLAFTK